MSTADRQQTARQLCLAAAGLLLGVAACGPAPEPPVEIRIGLIADPGSFASRPTVQGAEVAVGEVNDAGGLEVGGRRHRVVLRVAETENTQEGASRATLELIHRQGVVALVGSSHSRYALPEAEIADRKQIPIVIPGATHPRITSGKPYAFRVTFTNDDQSRALARFALHDLGAPPAAVLYDAANDYSRDLAEGFRRSYEADGGRIVAYEIYTSGETDFGDQLERIRDAGPGALFLPNLRPEVELQARQARALGIDATLLGGDAWLPRTMTGIPELEGSYSAAHWLPGVAEVRAEARTFIDDFRRIHGEDPLPSAAASYDACGLLMWAITAGGSSEPESIRRHLAELAGYRGVTGEITFRGTDGDPRKQVVIATLENGAVVLEKLVDPSPLSTSPAVDRVAP